MHSGLKRFKRSGVIGLIALFLSFLIAPAKAANDSAPSAAITSEAAPNLTPKPIRDWKNPAYIIQAFDEIALKN